MYLVSLHEGIEMADLTVPVDNSVVIKLKTENDDLVQYRFNRLFALNGGIVSFWRKYDGGRKAKENEIRIWSLKEFDELDLVTIVSQLVKIVRSQNYGSYFKA
jgi:hypothetical protein